MPLAIDQAFTSGQSFLDHCSNSMKYRDSICIRRALTPEPEMNSTDLTTPKLLAFESNQLILLARAILGPLPAKLSLLEIFNALRFLVSLSQMKNILRSIKCIEKMLSQTKSLALQKILDLFTIFEISNFFIAFKQFISIYKVRLKQSLNLTKEFGRFINDCNVNLNLKLYTSETEVLLFFKKWHRSPTVSKNPSIFSQVGALKGYNTSLDNIFFAHKSSKWIYNDKLVFLNYHIQFAFDNHTKPFSDNDDVDSNNSLRYIDKKKERATRNFQVKKKVKRAPAKSPYFFSSKKTCKEKALNLPTKLCRQFLSFSYHLKTPNVVPTLSEETSRKQSCNGAISCIPFPPLSESYFGLIQEKHADNPFHLLIAVTFLNRTHGKQAIPIYHLLKNRYPTPESFVAADMQEIVSLITCLGFQNQRANTCKLYASIWLQDPPSKNKRYAVRDYPLRGSGRDIKKGEILTDSDTRDAWEIGHMTSGPYALDAWRIFCRDKLRRVADGWNGEGACEGFQPEWMRVIPQDKELRAFLQWMWLKEGFLWNPQTGDKEVADSKLMMAALEGRILWDDINGLKIIN